MIKKIDIQKFGLFSDYSWNSEIGSDPDKDSFKKVNIIYGRNYSGKTTLSRIFRCVEKEEIHKDYPDAKFTISTDDDGTVINESNLTYSKNIRVYNTDFVKDNLSLLVDNDNGRIETFALIGDKNKEILEEIKTLQKELGDVEKGGLEKQYNDNLQALKIKENALTNQTRQINSTLKVLANDMIKVNENYFFITSQKRDYKITDVKIEIKQILKSKKSYLLDKVIEKQYISSLKETEKSKIDKKIRLTLPNLENYKSTVKELIERNISVTQTIDELVNNGELQKWVESGLKHHHSADERCAFCGNEKIGENRWKQLKEHFSKDFEDIKRDLNNEIIALKEARELYNIYFQDQGIIRDLFYSEYQIQFDQIAISWDKVIIEYKEIFDSFIEILEQRLNDIFTPKIFKLSSVEYPSEFEDIIALLNKLIEDNDSKSEKLFDQKQEKRKLLRFSLIVKSISEFEYKKKVENSKKLTNEIEKDNNALIEKKVIIEKLKREIKEKEDSFNDERTAARKINMHLNDFFGHGGIYFDVEESDKENAIPKSFKIKRGDEDAKNLSEGECSLIAFCYFMAKIEDELKDIKAKDNLIVYIDDPISSLDNNHIFFMFGLIESIITKTKNYNQLFISTHNLEFLRYLKRLTVPFDKIMKGDGKETSQKSWNHYLIYKNKNDSISQSHMRYMPKYLSTYTTEYNFLFGQIYKMALPDENKINLYENEYSLLYNLPNNMRKFLECFLFYKYPDTHNPLNDYLSKLFDGAIHPRVNRIINEYSHLTWGERGTIPEDIAEAEETAQLILRAVKSKDFEHFKALCKSIKVDHNIEL